jgi:hypothetical protein
MASTHLSGLNIGSGGDISKIMIGSVSIDPASLSAGAEADTSVTVTGAPVGAVVIVNPPTAGFSAGIELCGAWVSAANTVKVRIRNNTGGAVDQAAASCPYVIVCP